MMRGTTGVGVVARVELAAVAVDAGRLVAVATGSGGLPRAPLGRVTEGGLAGRGVALGMVGEVLPQAPPRPVRQLCTCATGDGAVIGYAALVPPGLVPAGGCSWAPVEALAPGGTAAAVWLGDAIGYEPLALELVGDPFSLSDLVEVYAAAWGARPDDPNFRRWILKTGAVLATGERRLGRGRPAELYTRAPGAPERFRLPLVRPARN